MSHFKHPEYCLSKEDGLPIMIMRHKQKTKPEYLFLNDHKETNAKCYTSRHFQTSSNCMIMPFSNGRDTIFICGPTGCGKTSFIYKYLFEVLNLEPDIKIMLFSEKENDCLDDFNPNRFLLHEDIANAKMEDMKDSIVIFDDIDSIYDKKTRSSVFGLVERVLKLGREYNISVIVTYHMLSNRNETRYILYECQKIVVFPHGGSLNQKVNLFVNYLGLGKKILNSIENLESRWVAVNKNYPNYYVYEHGAVLLK